MAMIKSSLTAETQALDRQLYEAALARRPEDISLVANFTQFLDANGFESDALQYGFLFRDLLPDTAWTHYYLAIQLANNGRHHEAEASLERSLEILSEFPRAEAGLEALRRRNSTAIPLPASPQ
jgi:tetratricopeptide (TPR) repeat protein